MLVFCAVVLAGVARLLADRTNSWLPLPLLGAVLVAGFGIPALIRRRNAKARQVIEATTHPSGARPPLTKQRRRRPCRRVVVHDVEVASPPLLPRNVDRCCSSRAGVVGLPDTSVGIAICGDRLRQHPSAAAWPRGAT